MSPFLPRYLSPFTVDADEAEPYSARAYTIREGIAAQFGVNRSTL